MSGEPIDDEPTKEERSAALEDFLKGQREIQVERKQAADLAVHSLARLVTACGQMTGQSYTLRNLLYSMWNGQTTSLLEVVTLDWKLREDFGVVLLAFGYESRSGPSFFYDAVKAAFQETGLFEWFCEAHKEEGTA